MVKSLSGCKPSKRLGDNHVNPLSYDFFQENIKYGDL